MPIMRSFTGFAATPDLAGAYNQGRAITQRAQESESQMQMEQLKLAQRAQEAGQQLQMEQQKIEAQQQNAAMEMQVKQQQLQQQLLKDQQEIQIESAYKEQMLGMQQREVKVKEDMLNMNVQKAARSVQENQSYQKEASDMISSGMDPDKAFMQSALKWGPEMDLPGSVYSAAMKQPDEAIDGFGQATDVEGLDPEKYKKFRTGKGSFQLVTMPEGMEEGAPEGYMKFGNRMLPERESIEVRDAKQERNRLIKLQDADIPGQRAAQEKESDPGKTLGKSKKIALDRFEARDKRIKEFESKLESRSSNNNPSTKYKEGDIIRSKKDRNKLYKIENGIPVPYNNEEE